LGGDGVEELGGGGDAELDHLAEKLSGDLQALGDVVGAIEVGIHDEALPADGGAGLLEVDPHDEVELVGDLVGEIAEAFGVFEAGFGVVDGAGADDDEEAGVLSGEDGSDGVAGGGHEGGWGVAAGVFRDAEGGRGQRNVLNDVEVRDFWGGVHGLGEEVRTRWSEESSPKACFLAVGRVPGAYFRPMKLKGEKLLRRLTEAHAVPGFEGEVREVFRKELDGAGKFSTDGNGSVLCELPGKGPRVLLAGHMDEVGFRVQSITSGGFLKLVALGGWWTHVLMAQRLQVKTSAGKKVMGVVASKPPHFLSAEERKKVMPLENLFLDLGATSAKEVEKWGVKIGDPVAPLTEFTPMERKGRFLAKAFDNRVGMACAIEAGGMLAEAKRSNTVLLAGTTQEEVGLRGAQTLAALAKPDVAVILEGTPADDTPGFQVETSQGIMGKGVQIRLHDPTAIMNPKLVELAVSVAEKEKIPYQLAVRASGGTDAGRVHLAGEGVPTVVLGVPARYIHSHQSMIEIGDYQAMVKLAAALIKKLTAAEVKKLTNYL
jgi:putative aminopeptidase FrvX